MDTVHSDKKIAARLLSGDESAFDAVFEGFFPRLYRFALARVDGDHDAAKDLVQLTFCKAFERIDTYRAEASLFGWMCQILRNALIDQRRKQRVEYSYRDSVDDAGQLMSVLDSLAAPEADEPEHELSRVHLLQVIQATLDFLPSHYGDVLELKYVDELSVHEIAERMALGPKAVESLLTRARNAFREAIAAIREADDLLPGQLASALKR